VIRNLDYAQKFKHQFFFGNSQESELHFITGRDHSNKYIKLVPKQVSDKLTLIASLARRPSDPVIPNRE
jgi:hypothetical protein